MHEDLPWVQVEVMTRGQLSSGRVHNCWALGSWLGQISWKTGRLWGLEGVGILIC